MLCCEVGPSARCVRKDDTRALTVVEVPPRANGEEVDDWEEDQWDDAAEDIEPEVGNSFMECVGMAKAGSRRKRFGCCEQRFS